MAGMPNGKRVVIVGGGVVGITTAWALAERGHTVDLFEAEAQVASQASASNAGLIVPGDSLVWASPAAVGMLIRALFPSKHGFIKVRLGAGLRLIPWGIRFLLECFPGRARQNTISAHRLSAYSLGELERIRKDLGLDFAFERNGMAFLAATGEQMGAIAEDRTVLASLGEKYDFYRAEDFAQIHRGYAAAAKTVGGVVYTTGAAHGDSEAFARALLAKAELRGVRVHRGTPIASVRHVGSRVFGVETQDGQKVGADVVVLAAGARTAALARSVGVRLPILPAKGYAVTVPPKDPEVIPTVGGVDERSHVAFSRVVGGLRLSSTAEFNGFDATSRPTDYAAIRTTGDSLWPGNLDWDRAVYHVGFRPATPHGNPFIGSTRIDGLFINSGHGHLGWTQAAGSAQIIADLVDQAEPAIDISPYTVH